VEEGRNERDVSILKEKYEKKFGKSVPKKLVLHVLLWYYFFE